MTTECPNCWNENAYFDGVEYVCPDCGHRWDCDEMDGEYDDYDSDDSNDDDIDCEVYVNGRKQ